MREPNL